MPTGPSLSEIPWKIADFNFSALWDPWFAAHLFCFGSHASQSGPIFNFLTDSGRYGPQFLESIKKLKIRPLSTKLWPPENDVKIFLNYFESLLHVLRTLISQPGHPETCYMSSSEF